MSPAMRDVAAAVALRIDVERPASPADVALLAAYLRHAPHVGLRPRAVYARAVQQLQGAAAA